MKKIAVIGANEFQLPLIKKINNLGYESHVFAWEDGAIAKQYATYFYPISISEKELILERCRIIGIDAVLTAGSDFAVNTVNYVADSMGLVSNGIKSTGITTNKGLMREKLFNQKLPVPIFKVISKEDIVEIDKIELPVIVKPTDRSGSRGVMKVTQQAGLLEAINYGINESFEQKVIIEEYVKGIEYSVEVISYEGVHRFLNITQKFTTGAPNFIETMHIQPPLKLEIDIEYVKDIVYKALDALEVKYGASHTEIKITSNKEIKIIEVGARMGGDFIGSHMVKISTKYDFLEGIINVALGKFEMPEKIENLSNAIVKFIFNEQDIDMLKQLKEEYQEEICEESLCNGEVGKLIRSSADRLGYYILNVHDSSKIKELVKMLTK